jgi:putative hydrolase of the HAD superfamily
MILIFDLDDTLYEERRYVESGFRAVAAFGEERFGWDRARSFAFMAETLAAHGRGAIFDRWLESHGRKSKTLVRQCLKVYWHHSPDIRLADEAAAILARYRDRPLYLVTDGHKIVQQKKVEALGIGPLFRKVYITHRFGIANAKPSIHCFERIRAREGCRWTDMVYIGDNPAKDFVGLRPLGVRTVRVLTGEHKARVAGPGADAEHRIAGLAELPAVIEGPAFTQNRATGPQPDEELEHAAVR